jgi:hypothetical protein
MSGEVTFPEFATSGDNEEEPSAAKKASGWTDGEEPAAEYLNWIQRRAYESAKSSIALAQANVAGYHTALALAHGATAPGSTYTVEVALWDDDVIVLGCDHDGTDYQIVSSEDGGLSFTDRSGPTAGTAPVLGAISPQRYAVIVISASLWLHAPYPYTSWSTVSASTFTSTTLRRMGLLPIDGEMSVVLTGDGTATNCYIEYTPADTEPTAAGSWTTLNITGSSTFDFYGMDYNDDYIAIAAAGSSAARVYYAATGTGGLAGDWSNVATGGGSVLYDIAWTGSRWVGLAASGSIRLSDDILTWTAGATIGTSCRHLICDKETGFLYAHGDNTEGIWVSRDEGLTWAEAITGGSNTMSAGGQRMGYDAKRRYLFGGDGSAIEKFMRTL